MPYLTPDQTACLHDDHRTASVDLDALLNRARPILDEHGQVLGAAVVVAELQTDPRGQDYLAAMAGHAIARLDDAQHEREALREQARDLDERLRLALTDLGRALGERDEARAGHRQALADLAAANDRAQTLDAACTKLREQRDTAVETSVRITDGTIGTVQQIRALVAERYRVRPVEGSGAVT